jgi:hypothetical protein
VQAALQPLGIRSVNAGEAVERQSRAKPVQLAQLSRDWPQRGRRRGWRTNCGQVRLRASAQWGYPAHRLLP